MRAIERGDGAGPRGWFSRFGRHLLLAAGLLGCEASQPCLAYACSSGAQMLAKIPWEARSGEFDVQLCHGDACSERIVPWNGDGGLTCDDDGFQAGDSACVEPTQGALEFSARWTFGEGVPREKTFRLRIVDRASGAVLLDESREAEFTPNAWSDHCHDCQSATMVVTDT